MAKRQTARVKGCRKGGRNKAWCTAYRLRGQKSINKRRRLGRHMKKNPNDGVAKQSLGAA